MANLKTVTNTIWVRLFFSSTAVEYRSPSTLKLDSTLDEAPLARHRRFVPVRSTIHIKFIRVTGTGTIFRFTRRLRTTRSLISRIESFDGRVKFQVTNDRSSFSLSRNFSLVTRLHIRLTIAWFLMWCNFFSYAGTVNVAAYVIAPKWRDSA